MKPALLEQAAPPQAVHEPPHVYLAKNSHVSHTMLGVALRSWREYEARYVRKTMPPAKESPELDLGGASHTLLLEPDKFSQRVAVYPEGLLDKRGAVSTNAAKAFRDEHRARGVTVLKPRDYDRVLKIRDAVLANPVARAMIEAAESIERSVYVQEPLTGIRLKARADLVAAYKGRSLLVDLKTAADVSPAGFAAAIERRGYYRQPPFYDLVHQLLDGVERLGVFIVVQSSEPFTCRTYCCHAEDVEAGRCEVMEGLRELARRYASGDWSEPGENVIVELKRPRWAYHKPWELDADV